MKTLSDFIKTLSTYENLGTSESNAPLSNRLFHLFEKYKKDVDGIFDHLSKKTDCKKKECNNRLSGICEKILAICDMYRKGNMSDAITSLYQLYFAENTLRIINIEKDTEMYRMRSASKNRLFLEEEMFHVPFELNYLLKNERYSISGFPSLYLGSSVYVCWEEMGRPDFNYANTALYKTKNQYVLLDMILPKREEELDLTTLFFIPLILASSLVISHPDGIFKEEYIIPQLVMHCLVKYNNENKDKEINGIRYESVHTRGKDCWYDKRDYSDKFINYVFPVVEISSKGQCNQLKKMFEYWNVISFNQYETKFYIRPQDKQVDINSRNIYKYSKFYQIEKFLTTHYAAMLTYDHHTAGKLT